MELKNVFILFEKKKSGNMQRECYRVPSSQAFSFPLAQLRTLTGEHEWEILTWEASRKKILYRKGKCLHIQSSVK